MKQYDNGSIPELGDIIESIWEDDGGRDGRVVRVDEDGSIAIDVGMGILESVNPEEFALVRREKDVIKLETEIALNGMGKGMFKEKYSMFLKENNLTTIERKIDGWRE